MSLVDPLSKAPFSISPLAKLPWAAPALSRYFITKARVAARKHDFQLASAFYTKALKLHPVNGFAWIQLGHSFGQLNHVDAAQLAYFNATQTQPQLASGHKHLGLIKYNTRHREAGMASLATALLLNPSDTDLRELLIGEEEETRVEARMAAAALTLADRHPSPGYIGLRATLFRSKARAAARRRQWDRAEDFYRRLVKMQPQDARSLIQLGHALNEQKKQLEAEHVFRRATAAAPLFPDAWLHLGYVLTARNKRQLAREAFAVVNRLAPSLREEHPILKSADLTSQGDSKLQNPLLIKRLTPPVGLGHREKAIWLRLAAQIERKL